MTRGERKFVQMNDGGYMAKMAAMPMVYYLHLAQLPIYSIILNSLLIL